MNDRRGMMAGDAWRSRAARESEDARAAPPAIVSSVLLTGGAGYVGSALVRGLLDDGLRVRVLDSLCKGDAGIRALYANPDFELVNGDIRRPEAVVRAVRGVDAVIHLAALGDDRECRRDQAAAIEVNVAATGLLTEVCRGMGVARMVFASTLDVYGRRGRTVDETSELEPRTLLAATKADAERLLLAAADRAFHPVVFRIGEIFGVDLRADYDRGLNRLVCEAWRAGGIPKRAGVRPYYRTHIADVCAAFRHALVAHTDGISREVFNVGCERMRFTDADTARLLAEAAPELGRPPAESRAALPGPEVSFRKLRSCLGVTCRGSLRQGLAELLAHLRRAGPNVQPRRPAKRPQSPSAPLAADGFLRGTAAPNDDRDVRVPGHGRQPISA